ncbi:MULTISPECIES: hypothetical protein [Desulfitobacterium]|uniref:Uncharacterized protein n=1 Tax=Desulfitobacterium dehalogenans (strain ATCC 51507 / DSM 9161 / JW/IU-DC1) TaxID=756499 RepID=I4A9W6_DESDJ|nr:MULTISPECIES: hypothetical protein [Desulfitobacterium]AFM00751.1 hypothetical protein Desde_2413 [Desulfitobacterium dehalogenans ATCC 51507]
MEVIMDPVEMIAKFKNGNPIPARFRYKDQVIDVQQILSTKEEKLAANRMKIYSCRSEIAGKMTRYELKFELQTCKWFLYRM